ncbi:MAG: DEAD/DEAH box helicase [Aigarchaeota archaeon]|nr:DEAD/DEAH box helicase [Aigarchaeota archaeon]MDW8092907.1 DEAD/DEAH box helicase [Nitrososphaerota archaeon]
MVHGIYELAERPIIGSERRGLDMETSKVLDSLGYEYFALRSEGVRPSRAGIRFKDLVPQLDQNLEIATKELYSHQVETLRALERSENVILRSGTGSGKTEAWFIYVAMKRVRALTVYPTLALANDQVNRLRRYCDALGMRAVIIDSPSLQEYRRSIGTRKLREELSRSDVVLTNPAFLLNELKRLGTERPPLLREFLEDLDLMVVDDLDFYNPRSLAIMLAMISIMREELSHKLRLVLLTAMLKNPEELTAYLKKVTGAETTVIDGEAFRPTNWTYVVLGKDLRALWERMRSHEGTLRALGVGQDVLEALRDYDRFRSSVYKLIEIARAANLDVSEELGTDPVEVLERYASDNGVTIVFTRSIAKAEEVGRSLRERIGDLVATHHHLLEKRIRAEIEERTRRGEVKILVSPRTLSQGIDIGGIVRTVHIGLPETLREFLQKEGRKGRREDIERTETVIFPSAGWDYNLLKRGPGALLKWLSLPREIVITNETNKYITLTKGLLRLSNPNRARYATKEELDLCMNLGLREDLKLNVRGRRAFNNLNFYEFAPPYGVKRVRKFEESERYLEDVSHVDLVERFQIGCIDYTSDGVVTKFIKPEVNSRLVTGVVVEDIVEPVMRRHEPLAYVLEEYVALSKRWGERPGIRRDYRSGLIHSEVVCVVRPPEGFNKYLKVPNRTVWTVRSRRPRIIVTGENRTYVVRESKTLIVPARVDGYYADYSYGTTVEVDPKIEPDMIRLGAAFMELVMRRTLSVPLETIKYDVALMGERKFLTVHEPDSAGLLERMDWMRLKSLVEEYNPDELDEVLLESVNEVAYSALFANGMDWEVARHHAISIIERFLAREKLRVEFRGRDLLLPRPSRALKRATVLLYMIQVGETSVASKESTSPYTLYSIAVFDGEALKAPLGIHTPDGSDEAYIESSVYISRLVDQGFKIYVYDLGSIEEGLKVMGMRSLRTKLLGLLSEGLIVDLSPHVTELLGSGSTLRDVVEAFGGDEAGSVTPIDLLLRSLDIVVGTRGWKERLVSHVTPTVNRLARQELNALYLLSLLASPPTETSTS